MNNASIYDLPSEIVDEIINNLSNKDYKSTQLTSKLFDVLSKEKIMYRKYPTFPIQKMLDTLDIDGITFSLTKLNRKKEFSNCLNKYIVDIRETTDNFINVSNKLASANIIYILLSHAIEFGSYMNKPIMAHIYKMIAISNDISSAELILSKDNNSLSAYKNIMILFALLYGSTDVFDLCVANKCKINSTNIYEYVDSNIGFIVNNKNVDIYMKLYGDKYYRNLDNFWTKLNIKIFDDDKRINFLSMLLNSELHGKESFLYIIESGEIQLIDDYIKSYGVPTIKKYIDKIFEKSYFVQLKYIFDNYKFRSEDINYGLYSASIHNNKIFVEYFFSLGADPNFNRSDAIFYCIEKKYTDIINIYINYGAKVSKQMIMDIANTNNLNLFNISIKNYYDNLYDLLEYLIIARKSKILQTPELFINVICQKIVSSTI